MVTAMLLSGHDQQNCGARAGSVGVRMASSQQCGRDVAIDLAITADKDDAVASWISLVPLHF
jgi:hypothetical protein